MRTIKKKVLWVILTLFEYTLIISSGALLAYCLFAYCWMTFGFSEFVCSMFITPFLLVHIALADKLKEMIMAKVFMKKETQSNI